MPKEGLGVTLSFFCVSGLVEVNKVTEGQAFFRLTLCNLSS